MNLLLEIPTGLLGRLSEAVDRNGFASINEFALLALENQLSVEGQPAPPREPIPTSSRTPWDSARNREMDTRKYLSASATVSARLSVEESGWLWGIINRVLPIKFVARQLLQLTGSEPIPLELARKQIAAQATETAAWIATQMSTARDRHDTLITGFPVREPLYPAEQRFINYFLGRIESMGHARGALFELGLAGIVTGSGKPAIALTEIGYGFASLANPVLDSSSIEASISEEEINFYVSQIVPVIPRELDCFTLILLALKHQTLGVEELDTRVLDHLPNRFSRAAVQSQKAGALGRLRDLALIERKKLGVSASFEITKRGLIALKAISPAAGKTKVGEA